jgi:hypothetical protein
MRRLLPAALLALVPGRMCLGIPVNGGFHERLAATISSVTS